MNKFSPGVIVISFVVAVVVMYFIVMRQEGMTQQQGIINALAGGVGMLVGLLLYNRFLGKDDNNDELP